MKFILFIIVAAGIFFCSNKASAQQIKPEALTQIQSLLDEKEARTAAQKKLASQLWYAIKQDRGELITPEVPRLELSVNRDTDGKIKVEIRGSVDNVLINAIINAGGDIVSRSRGYNRVTARLPMQAIERIASIPQVQFISQPLPPRHANASVPSLADNRMMISPVAGKETLYKKDWVLEMKNFRPGFAARANRVREQVIKALNAKAQDFDLPVGTVTSQGDATHKAALARTTFNLDGSGIKIGILSDSYNSGGGAAANVTAGDLPGTGNPNGFLTPVTVLSDVAGESDEGRAMLQIVHDLAPGAELYFASAFMGEASFAQSILDLRVAGCDIICDDVY